MGRRRREFNNPAWTREIVDALSESSGYTKKTVREILMALPDAVIHLVRVGQHDAIHFHNFCNMWVESRKTKTLHPYYKDRPIEIDTHFLRANFNPEFKKRMRGVYDEE